MDGLDEHIASFTFQTGVNDIPWRNTALVGWFVMPAAHRRDLLTRAFPAVSSCLCGGIP